MILHEILKKYLVENNWDMQVVGDPLAFAMRFRGQSGQWSCVAQAVEDQGKIVFFSISPEDVPHAKRIAMAEFLTSANYGLLVGNFEMNFSTGDLRFRTSLDASSGTVDDALLYRLVHTNLAMMDTYLPGIQKILRTDVSPQAVLAQIR